MEFFLSAYFRKIKKEFLVDNRLEYKIGIKISKPG